MALQDAVACPFERCLPVAERRERRVGGDDPGQDLVHREVAFTERDERPPALLPLLPFDGVGDPREVVRDRLVEERARRRLTLLDRRRWGKAIGSLPHDGRG